ncbi:MAG: high frequency lysogenization protein [Pseudohongiellaceae bacterium]
MQEFSNSQSQALALAAIIQSAQLVDQLAVTGKVAPESFNPLMQSLFAFDSEHPAMIYGGAQGVDAGLRQLAAALSGNQTPPNRSIMRYALAMIHLQGKLSATPEQMNIIASRLQHIQFKKEHFSNDINSICSSVAAVYKDTISTFKSRIHVSGNAIHLQNQHNADQIRTLLLAGIRACVLWRQMGGKRWHFITSRKRLLKATESILNA